LSEENNPALLVAFGNEVLGYDRIEPTS